MLPNHQKRRFALHHACYLALKPRNRYIRTSLCCLRFFSPHTLIIEAAQLSLLVRVILSFAVVIALLDCLFAQRVSSGFSIASICFNIFYPPIPP